MADVCRSCGRIIRWTITDKGRRMPIDPEPVLNGNLRLTKITTPTLTGTALVDIAMVIKPNPHTEAYVSHFATCPKARQHRRGKR